MVRGNLGKEGAWRRRKQWKLMGTYIWVQDAIFCRQNRFSGTHWKGQKTYLHPPRGSSLYSQGNVVKLLLGPLNPQASMLMQPLACLGNPGQLISQDKKTMIPHPPLALLVILFSRSFFIRAASHSLKTRKSHGSCSSGIKEWWSGSLL